MANAFSSLIFFLIITTIYFFIKFYVKSHSTVWMIIYFLMVVVGEYFINLSITKDICGSNQYTTAISITLIPWVFIFGLLNLMLLMFPGWLSPFSNTFGYIVTKLAGVNDLLDDILVPKIIKTKSSDSDNVKAVSEALESIYADKSLFINEISLANFDNMWDRMNSAGLFKQTSLELKDKLRNMVRLKYLISEYIWFALTGTLVTSVSYNYIVNAGCQQSVSDMEQRHNDMIEQEENKDTPDNRVYLTNE